jgi:hypothetical protein
MSDNSRRKLAIGLIEKPDGSKWIDVALKKYGPPHPRFIPSFLDLHRIIRAIAYCEDLKYPPPTYQGRYKLAEFLWEAGLVSDFNALADKYQIPERDGDRVIDTHGANVAGPRPARVTLFDE